MNCKKWIEFKFIEKMRYVNIFIENYTLGRKHQFYRIFKVAIHILYMFVSCCHFTGNIFKEFLKMP